LNEITRDELQTFLEEKASSGLSFSVVDHLRWDLSQIFNLARSEGAIHRNPAEFLVTPKNATKPERSVMSRGRKEVCCGSAASRTSDLQTRHVRRYASRRNLGAEVEASKRRIGKDQQRVYRSEIDTPKTRTSKRAIALSGGIREDIAAWRTFVLVDGPEAWSSLPRRTLRYQGIMFGVDFCNSSSLRWDSDGRPFR
jgi:hypothetical protein